MMSALTQFSMPWKKTAAFSTQWKKFSRFFHAMENPAPAGPCRGKKRRLFPHNGKSFGRFSTQWKIPRLRDHRAEKYGSCNYYTLGTAGFTLVELLTTLGGLGLLAAILAGTLPGARAAAEAAACRSNLRQLAAANLAYAADHGRYVAAAADIEGNNSIRWHGVRSGKEFDGEQGPLAPYLGGGGASAWVRRCPAFRPAAAGFEAACGGYGYNALGVGSEVCLPVGGGTTRGMQPGAIAHPAQTVMFADTAFLQGGGQKAKLIEYSFAEPPRFAGGGTPWPSIHFRHRARANVAWCDGHVSAEAMAGTDGRSTAYGLGWFGPDDNSLFDPF